jgi:hypothetical protein
MVMRFLVSCGWRSVFRLIIRFGRDANAFLRFLANYLLPLLAPHIKYWSTPKRAAQLAAKVPTDESGQSGIYYDEGGHPMLSSVLVQNPKFQDRVTAETRDLLSIIPT